MRVLQRHGCSHIALVLSGLVGCTQARTEGSSDWSGGSNSVTAGNDPTGVPESSSNTESSSEGGPDSDSGPSGDSQPTTGEGDSQPTSDPGEDSSQPTTDPGGDDSQPSSDTDETRFDLGDDGSSCDPDRDPSCKGCKKIDFLFIVDNSDSMEPHQTNLLNSFGPFIDTITTTVQGTNYHVMVLDSDSSTTQIVPPPPVCETTLGAGQVRNCPVPGGVRYLTSALDPVTLKSTFQCLANVGATGSADEMPMTALVEAIGPLNAPGQCNQGFLRNDAILVVTIISDDHSGWPGTDNECGYGGTPQSWFDAVIAAKGKVENVVVLGLYALLSDQSCIEHGPEQADQFIEFTEKFGSQGIIDSVCEPDYNNPFFQDAVGLIDTTCEAFIPPE